MEEVSIKAGVVVQFIGKLDRRARYAGLNAAVALAEPFEQDGKWVCPVGFFSAENGAWARIVPLQDIAATDELPDAPDNARTNKSLLKTNCPEYRLWIAMRRRCSDPRDPGFYLYGNRVKVCPEWGSSFEQFFQDMGPRPSPRHSLDRIDNDGDYKPGNVRWATPTEQARNRSQNRIITAFGQTKTLVEWATELGISYQALDYRLGKWPVEVALSRPKQPHASLKSSLESKRQRGVGHYKAKLTDEQVLEIRKAYQTGETQAFLARRYGVTFGTIASIVRGKTWKHLFPKEKENNDN